MSRVHLAPGAAGVAGAAGAAAVGCGCFGVETAFERVAAMTALTSRSLSTGRASPVATKAAWLAAATAVALRTMAIMLVRLAARWALVGGVAVVVVDDDDAVDVVVAGLLADVVDSGLIFRLRVFFVAERGFSGSLGAAASPSVIVGGSAATTVRERGGGGGAFVAAS